MENCKYVTLCLDCKTDTNLAFLAALMHVSKDKCVSFLINKTIENLIPELKKNN